jgi:hypothetical protein
MKTIVPMQLKKERVPVNGARFDFILAFPVSRLVTESSSSRPTKQQLKDQAEK